MAQQKVCCRFCAGSLFVALLVAASWYNASDRRPPCVDGDFGDHCRPAPVESLEGNPVLALVGLDENLTELRWATGRLYHPIGAYFGGQHSALIAKFSSGRWLKIEKLGVGQVVFCPSATMKTCNMNGGNPYKVAKGRFLKPGVTWRQLHAEMAKDSEHYDVIDANCHHTVQRTWNAVVLDEARDDTPAPDNKVLARFESFLRWWSGTETSEANRYAAREEERPDDLEVSPSRRLNFVMRWDVFPDVAEYSTPSIRRRRRRVLQGARCRASKIEGWNRDAPDPACPPRQSCVSEGKPCSCDSEWYKKTQTHWWGPSTQRKDKDSSSSSGPSDSKFSRQNLCGWEWDLSGSLHMRWKSSASSAIDSCGSDMCNEIQPMDPRNDLFWGASAPGGQCEGSCVRSGSEFSFSQNHRSKDHQGGLCGNDMAVDDIGTSGSRGNASFQAVGTDQLCQWTCQASTEPLFHGPSKSEWKCNDDVKELLINSGDRLSDCAYHCASDCSSECMKACVYVASGSLNDGTATCVKIGTKAMGMTLNINFTEATTPAALSVSTSAKLIFAQSIAMFLGSGVYVSDVFITSIAPVASEAKLLLVTFALDMRNSTIMEALGHLSNPGNRTSFIQQLNAILLAYYPGASATDVVPIGEMAFGTLDVTAATFEVEEPFVAPSYYFDPKLSGGAIALIVTLSLCEWCCCCTYCCKKGSRRVSDQ